MDSTRSKTLLAGAMLACLAILVILSFYDSFGKRRAIATSNALISTLERREIAVDPQKYDQYVGIYQLEPRFYITISTDGERLFAQGSNQIRVEIHPASVDTYFNDYTNALIVFQTDAGGGTSRFTLRQPNKIREGKKIATN